MKPEANKSTHKPYSRRLLRVLVGMILFVLSTHLVLQYLNLEVFYQQNGQVYELSNRFDLDDESSLPTWLSQAVFLVISAGALLAASFQAKKAARRMWRLIAAIGLLFSLDEATTLHEYILQTLHVLFFQDASPTGKDNAWWLVTPFILLAAGWLAWQALRLLPRHTTFLFVLGGISFLTGSVVVDLLISIAPRETFLNQGILVAIEETLELIGSSIALYAVADYLETHHYPALSNAVRQLRSSRTSTE